MEETVTSNMLEMKEGDINLLNENTEPKTMINVEELPSEFKGYPAGTKISFAPLTLEELEALNSSEIDPARGIAMLLKAIHCTTLNSVDLYYWDVMFIGIKRKLLAFGDTRGTIYNRCPKCGHVVSKTFNLTELEFKQMEAPNLPMRMKVAGKELEFCPLTIKDFLQIETDQGELGVYARMIRNMEFDEAYELVRNVTGVDIKKLRFADKQLDYRIQPFFVTCEGEEKPCGNEVVMEVRSPFEVVFPEDEADGYNDLEVQYG